MPTIKLTSQFIKTLTKPESGKVIYWDTELKGFGLRITPTAMTYIAQARVNGRQICSNVGKHGTFTPAEARERATQLLGEMAKGIDINAKKVEDKVASITLQEAYETYRKKDLREKTLKIYDNVMNKYLSDWKNKPITKITEDMIEEKHREISNLNGPRGKGEAIANQSFRFLRAVFFYAMSKYKVDGKPLITYNPVKCLSARRAWNKNRKRKDVIKDLQLKPWYDAVMLLRHDTARDYLLLCILTGLRRTEALTLEWKNVDFVSRTIKIEESVVKTGEQHELPLSDFLFDMLERRSKIPGNPYVFPGNDRVSHMKEPKSSVASVVKNSGVKFSPHTLRRTFETQAETLEIPYFALKALLNHKVADQTADYIQINTERLRKPMQQITDHFLKAFHQSN